MLPVSMLLKELNERGPRMGRRTLEYALAKAVRAGHLRVVKGTDDGALYVLASYADANPKAVEWARRHPIRMLQRQGPDFNSKAVRRWIHADGLKGTHDLRAGHKCIPCGNVPHRNPEFPDIAERRKREATGMKLVRGGSPVS